MKNKYIGLWPILILCGCAYHSQTQNAVTPATYSTTPYRSNASIGKLRKIALMPLQLEVLEGQIVPRKDKTVSAEAFNDLKKYYTDGCAKFLHNEKGYDITNVIESNGEWRTESANGDSSLESTMSLQAWLKEKPGKHDPQTIRIIGKHLNQDALMEVSIRKERSGSEGWMYMQTFLVFLTMHAVTARAISSPDISVWIYESSTGNLVWTHEISGFMYSSESGFTAEDFADLFLNLENAVPVQLID